MDVAKQIKEIENSIKNLKKYREFLLGKVGEYEREDFYTKEDIDKSYQYGFDAGYEKACVDKAEARRKYMKKWHYENAIKCDNVKQKDKKMVVKRRNEEMR